MVEQKIFIITNVLFLVMRLSSGPHNVGRGRSTIVTAATLVIITMVFMPLTVSTNNNILFESNYALAQIQEGGGAGTTNTTAITNDTTTKEPRAFLSYQNPTYDIFMQYPSDWIASTSGLPDYTNLIAFYSPLQNLSDSFPTRLTISVIIYSHDISLPEYTDFVWTMVNQSEQVNLRSSSEVTVGGYPGFRMVLANQPFQNSTLVLYHMNTWTTLGNKVYLLTYEADESTFNRYLPEVSQMLETLKIARNNTTMTGIENQLQ